MSIVTGLLMCLFFGSFFGYRYYKKQKRFIEQDYEASEINDEEMEKLKTRLKYKAIIVTIVSGMLVVFVGFLILFGACMLLINGSMY